MTPPTKGEKPAKIFYSAIPIVTQCPISKWFSQDEFGDVKLSNDI